MWTARVPVRLMEIILEGKQVEVMLEEGLLTIEQAPNAEGLVIRFLTREEAGLRF